MMMKETVNENQLDALETNVRTSMLPPQALARAAFSDIPTSKYSDIDLQVQYRAVQLFLRRDQRSRLKINENDKMTVQLRGLHGWEIK